MITSEFSTVPQQNNLLKYIPKMQLSHLGHGVEGSSCHVVDGGQQLYTVLRRGVMDAMNEHLQQGMKDAPHMALVHNWQQVVYWKVFRRTMKVLSHQCLVLPMLARPSYHNLILCYFLDVMPLLH